MKLHHKIKCEGEKYYLCIGKQDINGRWIFEDDDIDMGTLMMMSTMGNLNAFNMVGYTSANRRYFRKLNNKYYID